MPKIPRDRSAGPRGNNNARHRAAQKSQALVYQTRPTSRERSLRKSNIFEDLHRVYSMECLVITARQNISTGTFAKPRPREFADHELPDARDSQGYVTPATIALTESKDVGQGTEKKFELLLVLTCHATPSRAKNGFLTRTLQQAIRS